MDYVDVNSAHRPRNDGFHPKNDGFHPKMMETSVINTGDFRPPAGSSDADSGDGPWLQLVTNC